MFQAVDRLRAVASEAGIEMLELALRWLHGRPGVSGALIGGSRIAHVTTNLDALEQGPLDVWIVEQIDAIGDWLDGPVPAYNR